MSTRNGKAKKKGVGTEAASIPVSTGSLVTSLSLSQQIVDAVDAVALREQRSRSFIVMRAIKRDLGLEAKAA